MPQFESPAYIPEACLSAEGVPGEHQRLRLVAMDEQPMPGATLRPVWLVCTANALTVYDGASRRARLSTFSTRRLYAVEAAARALPRPAAPPPPTGSPPGGDGISPDLFGVLSGFHPELFATMRPPPHPLAESDTRRLGFAAFYFASVELQQTWLGVLKQAANPKRPLTAALSAATALGQVVPPQVAISKATGLNAFVPPLGVVPSAGMLAGMAQAPTVGGGGAAAATASLGLGLFPSAAAHVVGRLPHSGGIRQVGSHDVLPSIPAVVPVLPIEVSSAPPIVGPVPPVGLVPPTVPLLPVDAGGVAGGEPILDDDDPLIPAIEAVAIETVAAVVAD